MSGIFALIVGYILYRKFWDSQTQNLIEEELQEVLQNDEYKVKGKFE